MANKRSLSTEKPKSRHGDKVAEIENANKEISFHTGYISCLLHHWKKKKRNVTDFINF